MKIIQADVGAGPITPSNMGGRYRVGKVLVDNKNGLGGTPNNQEIEYFGFVGFITPNKFFGLAAHSDTMQERGDQIEKAMHEKGIGNPFLSLKTENDQAPWGNIRVDGHEGRARMSVVARLNGANTPFPIHFFVRQLRARHLSLEFFQLLNKQGVTPERMPDSMLVQAGISRVLWKGQDIDLSNPR